MKWRRKVKRKTGTWDWLYKTSAALTATAAVATAFKDAYTHSFHSFIDIKFHQDEYIEHFSLVFTLNNIFIVFVVFDYCCRSNYSHRNFPIHNTLLLACFSTQQHKKRDLRNECGCDQHKNRRCCISVSHTDTDLLGEIPFTPCCVNFKTENNISERKLHWMYTFTGPKIWMEENFVRKWIQKKNLWTVAFLTFTEQKSSWRNKLVFAIRDERNAQCKILQIVCCPNK